MFKPSGEQARIVEYVQRWYPKFSTGTMSSLLLPDEKPGQIRYSKYIPLINQYLWPEGELDESLLRVARTMTADEQRAFAAMAEIFLSTRKPK